LYVNTLVTLKFSIDTNPSSISDIFNGVLDGVVDLNGAVAINLPQ
jgi:hypothetical protein